MSADAESQALGGRCLGDEKVWWS